MPNIIQRLFRIIGGFNYERSSLIFGTANKEVYADIKSSQAITQGYNSNTTVYSIVTKAAKKFGSIPRYVKVEGQKEPLNNELSKLLNRPNEYQGQDAFLALAYSFYKVCGETFIWLNRGEQATYDDIQNGDDTEYSKRPVIEMYILPSDKMIGLPDPENLYGVIGWELDLGGKRIPFRKADILHWKNTNLNFDAFSREQVRGRPPLSSGYKTLQQNNDATNSAVRMYQNDGSKGAFVNKTYDQLTPKQKSDIQNVVDAKINNNDVKGAIAVLQGEWMYHDLSSSIDQKLLEGKELTWKELCFLFGVPYEFFDSHTPYAEKQLAMIGWLTQEIIPDSRQLDDELNRVLTKSFSGQGKIECDYWDLPEMQEVRLKTAEALMKVWPVTPNQVLEAMGYEPRKEPEFDEPWVPSNVTPYSQTGQDLAGAEDQLRQMYDNGGN